MYSNSFPLATCKIVNSVTIGKNQEAIEKKTKFIDNIIYLLERIKLDRLIKRFDPIDVIHCYNIYKFRLDNVGDDVGDDNVGSIIISQNIPMVNIDKLSRVYKSV
jgi:hypothetical protein